MLVICAVPFASARTGDNLREGVRNGTSTAETQIISNIGSTLTPTGGYSTRQSNLSNSGGGAVYGCRSQVGGSAAKPRPQNPCLRANNLNTGYAFEFHASNGPITGLISAGAGGDTKKPFVTNATGVATGLNADRVDNLDAAQIVTAARLKTGLDADTLDGVDSASFARLAPFALVNADGTVGAGDTRGVPANGTAQQGAGDYSVVFTGDLSKCALTATVRGTVGGEISVVPAVADGNTTVDVRTFNSAGAAFDRAFHLSANC
jgi:hypothetical protein